MKKIIFIASYGSSKKHMNGESNKSKDILDALKKKYKVSAFNMDKFKFFNTLRFIFTCMFFRKRTVFIAKAPSGCALILKILKFLKYPKHRIISYIYGFGLNASYYSKLTPRSLSYCDALIVESEIVRKEFFEISNYIKIFVWPTLKKIYDIPQKEFVNKESIKVIFFSRVVEEKGVFDAIKAVVNANEKLNKVVFTLDIAGSVSSIDDVKLVKEYCKKYDYIHLLGESFSIQGRESYLRLSEYDIHVFLSKFAHECAPGSILDSFIAGVPTLATRYNSYETLINDNIAFFVDNDLKSPSSMLIELFNNQEKLFSKRSLLLLEAKKYTPENFLSFFDKAIS